MKRRVTDEQLESTKKCIAGANCRSCKANHKICDTADDLIRALSSDLLDAVETIRDLRKCVSYLEKNYGYTFPHIEIEKIHDILESTKEYE